MNKETGEIIKNIIDLFVSRESLLKELIDNKAKEIEELKNQIKEFNQFLS